jgi:hypothetical protein
VVRAFRAGPTDNDKQIVNPPPDVLGPPPTQKPSGPGKPPSAQFGADKLRLSDVMWGLEDLCFVLSQRAAPAVINSTRVGDVEW